MRTEPSMLHIYSVGQKFRRNRSISLGLGDTILILSFTIARVSCIHTLWVKNFTKSLYVAAIFVKNSKWPPERKIFEN